MRHTIFALAAMGAFAQGCGKGGDLLDPTGGGVYVLDGLELKAEVVQVVHERTSVIQVSLQVTLTNTTSDTVRRAYPGGCPVLIRLYRAQDLALVYDEGQRPCGSTTPVDVILKPGESTMLTSGLRFPWAITGDSLSAGAYYAAALLRITGVNPIELDAGIYVLPHCEEIYPVPGAPGQTVCN